MQTQVTLGVIITNRGFFPGHLCESAREIILKALSQENIGAVILDAAETANGSVESVADAQKCADLFRARQRQIDGILVTLPNFGDERAVANAIRWSGLNVPVLVHAFPDEPDRMAVGGRRDAFCGKISVSNNLRQYGIPFSLTERHVVAPESPDFQADLRRFAAVCRVVRGLRGARVGILGARPAAFNTVRFSEQLLERSGISVETLDLSEVFDAAKGISVQDPRLRNKLSEIREYLPTGGVSTTALERMAQLGLAIEDWMAANRLQAIAIQCWSAMQKVYGVVPCTLMSMLNNRLIPSACETDVPGVIGMLALTLASERPAALVDWNNNFGEDPDLAVLFHCSNFPKDLLAQENPASEDEPRVGAQAILAQTYGVENTCGAVSGRLRASPVTYLRVSTDDLHGKVRGYVGEGELLDQKLATFGGYGVVRIPRFQRLLKMICEQGFEHHVALSPAQVAQPVYEALSRYLGWEIVQHFDSSD